MPRYIVFAIIGIIAGYFVLVFATDAIYGHKLDTESTAKNYTWLFNDSVKPDIENSFSFSYVKKRDVYNAYTYGKYSITIWAFKDLKSIDLGKINIYKNVDLDAVSIYPGETINVHSVPEVTMRYGFSFHNNIMNVNLGQDSKVDTSLVSIDYKGFYGTFDKVSFSNAVGKDQILFNYISKKQYSFFCLYKNRKGFFVLIIDANDPLDPQNLINIFNLQ